MNRAGKMLAACQRAARNTTRTRHALDRLEIDDLKASRCGSAGHGIGVGPNAEADGR